MTFAALRGALIRPQDFGATAEPARVATLRTVSWEAFRAESGTHRTHMETVNLMRLGRAAITAQPDGVSVGGPMVEDLLARGALRRDDFADPQSQAYGMMVGMQRGIIDATPAFVWLAGADTREAAFDAGRDWLRLNLAATGLGLGLHPWSQALQEFPEVATHYAATHAALGKTSRRVQMLGRLGVPVGESVRVPTPRWPAESRILPG